MLSYIAPALHAAAAATLSWLLQLVVVCAAGLHWRVHAACCLHGQQGLTGGDIEEHPRSNHCTS
jgi:hypothetical protein